MFTNFNLLSSIFYLGKARAQEQIGPMRNRWTEEEDRKLVECMERHGERVRWTDVPNLAGLDRTWKSCKLRWKDFRRPGIETGPFSEDEENTIWQLYLEHGNKWTQIAEAMQHRTATQIKNLWNTRLKTKFLNSTSNTAASSGTSMVNQVLEIGEITPSDKEIANPSSSTSTTFETFEAWPELLTDNETSDFFCGDISLH